MWKAKLTVLEVLPPVGRFDLSAGLRPYDADPVSVSDGPGGDGVATRNHDNLHVLSVRAR